MFHSLLPLLLWALHVKGRTVSGGHYSPDWYRCHGLPCDEWKEVETIMIKLAGTNTILNDHQSKDMLHPKHNEEAMDIWFTKKQAEDMLKVVTDKETSGDGHRIKRKVASFQKGHEDIWDLPILYKFDGTHSEEDKEVIRKAFQNWMENTCLVFFEVNREAVLGKTHLVITNSDTGRCASFIGKVMPPGEPQLINLGSSCLVKIGVPIHEIGHAIGLWHEHQRGDRDLNINILSQNIGWWAKPNFVPAPDGYMEYYDIPYDFNSVMHYGPLTGTMFGRRTIESKDQLFQENMGQRLELSFLDAKAINRAYCGKKCRQPLRETCQHSGYQDPNDCSKCRCPSGLYGTSCQNLAPSTGSCGGLVFLDSRQDNTIMSPGYEEKADYPEYAECNWLVKAPPGHTVILQFHGDFGMYSSDGTCLHWLEANAGPSFGVPGPRFCGKETPTVRFESFGEEMLLTMRSGFSSQETGRRGFKAIVSAVPPAPGGYNAETSDGNNRIRRGHSDLPSNDAETTTRESTTTRPPPPTTKTTTKSTTRTITSTTTTEPKSTTQTTKTTSTTFSTTEAKISEFSWSEWSECFGSDCACGSCSHQTRDRLCDGKRCPYQYSLIETRACSRVCTDEDTKLFFAGRIFSLPCLQCCAGFQALNGQCIPYNS